MAAGEITYFEDVNVGCTCPHEDAFAPKGDKTYYRIIKAEALNSECFLPTPIREDRPLPDGFDDCIGKSVIICVIRFWNNDFVSVITQYRKCKI